MFQTIEIGKMNKIPVDKNRERITKKFQDFKASDPINSYLPVKFGNETDESLITRLTTTCPQCGCDIPDNHFRGTVNDMLSDKLIVYGTGFCQKCSLIIPNTMRIYPDWSMDVYSGGRWIPKGYLGGKTQKKQKTFIQKLMDFLSGVKKKVWSWK